MRLRIACAAALLTLPMLAGCDAGGGTDGAPNPRTPTSHRAGGVAAGDWPTYHRSNARDGYAADLAPLSSLETAWHARLDGAVYGQPLVIGDRLYAATEHDTIYALNADTGRVIWSRHLGRPVPVSDLPCGNIDPLGITGTMAYDAATDRLFAVAETDGGTHTLVGVSATTGKVEVATRVEPPRGEKLAHQQRAALTVLDGRVYIPYGGLYGDCGDYIGSVVSVTTDGADKITYAIPTSREGGIWAPGGAAVAGNRLYYAVGNGESTSTYDGSDAVIALTPTLRRAGYYSPPSWRADNAADLDLGSMSPAVVGDYVYGDGKRGEGYVLRRGGLGHVATLRVCPAFGAPSVVGSTVYVPCPDGPRAVTVSGHPKVRWHADVPAAGSPVVGGGAVWVVDYDGGTLYALDPATGATRASLHIGAAPHFASPTLARDRAYVGLLDGVVAVSGA